MTKKKNHQQHNQYQKYLEEKHRKLNTSDKIINRIVKKATGSFIASKKRIIEGEVNEVHEVTTKNKQSVIVRISRSKHPRFKGEAKAIKLALLAGVPAPKVLLIEKISQGKNNLTFCVEEKIDGKSLNKLMKKLDKDILKSIIFEAGEILSRIHSVNLNGFGGFYKDKLCKNWTEYVLRPEKKIERIIKAAKVIGIDVRLINKAIEILKQHRLLYEKVKPQLLHGDFSAKHFLIKNNHIVGIIDFENAKGGDPVFDFAWLDYFYGQVIPTDWLRKRYKNKDLFDGNFELKMKLYKLHLGLSLIDYYEHEKNQAGMNHAKKKIIEELKNF